MKNSLDRFLLFTLSSLLLTGAYILGSLCFIFLIKRKRVSELITQPFSINQLKDYKNLFRDVPLSGRLVSWLARSYLYLFSRAYKQYPFTIEGAEIELLRNKLITVKTAPYIVTICGFLFLLLGILLGFGAILGILISLTFTNY